MTKAWRYSELKQSLTVLLEGETNQIARMATLVGLLHQSFEQFFWTGFYLVDADKPNELVIGPYQGTLGCLRIPFGKGVCGVAAQTRQVQIVADVHQFPGHIACDSRSNSEIVLPYFSSTGELLGVLDVDSEQFAAFDEEDAKGLAELLEKIQPA